MLKNIKNLTGVNTLSKEEQKIIKGGVIACPPGQYLFLIPGGGFYCAERRLHDKFDQFVNL